MERTDFLKLCQKCAIVQKGHYDRHKDIADEFTVILNGIKYFPVKYELYFDTKGVARHTAILRDWNSNSIVSARLDRVEPYIKKTIVPKEDCKFYKNERTCIGLNKLYCKTEECSFYKPKDDNLK